MIKQKLTIRLLSLTVALTMAWSVTVQGQVNPYKARNDGYYVGLMDSKSGLVATSNRADEIFLVKNGTTKTLVNSRNCGQYMQINADKTLIGFKSISDDYSKQAPAVLDIATGKVTLLEPYSSLCGQVSFSDNGTMAYTLGNTLVVRNGNTRRTFDLGLYVNIVNISPDASKVAFTSIEGNSYIVDTATGEETRIEVRGNAAYNPVWAPDGKKIAYEKIDGTLTVVDVNTKANYDIGEAMSPVWTADSKEIIFTRAQRENDIFVPSASVIKSSFDGSKSSVIIARSENVPVAVTTLTDGGLAVSYATGEQRGIYKLSGIGNGNLRSVNSTPLLAAKG
ncbi:MAG: PD40 domain-containing protein, partial [Muribaculaceae bacterium]|nr:PD40 domain-containing protein [Muribaculaceae bacterium]